MKHSSLNGLGSYVQHGDVACLLRCFHCRRSRSHPCVHPHFLLPSRRSLSRSGLWTGRGLLLATTLISPPRFLLPRFHPGYVVSGLNRNGEDFGSWGGFGIGRGTRLLRGKDETKAVGIDRVVRGDTKAGLSTLACLLEEMIGSEILFPRELLEFPELSERIRLATRDVEIPHSGGHASNHLTRR